MNNRGSVLTWSINNRGNAILIRSVVRSDQTGGYEIDYNGGVVLNVVWNIFKNAYDSVMW